MGCATHPPSPNPLCRWEMGGMGSSTHRASGQCTDAACYAPGMILEVLWPVIMGEKVWEVWMF